MTALDTAPATAPPPAQGRPLADAAVLLRRNLLHAVRNPFESLISALIPLMMMLLFGFVFGDALAPGGDVDAYRSFLMPGLIAMVMLNGVGGTAAGVAVDAGRDVMGRFRSLPMAPSALLTGRAAADTLKAAVEIVPVVGAGLLMGWSIDAGPGGMLGAVALVLLLRMAFIWAGILLGLAVRNPDTASMIVYPLTFPLTVLSTAFLDPALMPGWVGTVAEWNPLSATIDATRELLGAGSAAGAWPRENALLLAVAWPAAITAVCAALSVRRFRSLRD
ncbi:ABC transporter permease [Nocardiopsis coralliicola]